MHAIDALSCLILLAMTLAKAVGADSPPGQADVQRTWEPIPGVVESRMVVYTYKKTPEKELKLYVHFPEGWKATDKRAGIVFFFGGGFIGGTPEQFRRAANYFASRGMIAARADYRVNMGVPVALEDAKTAVRWMRGHAAELGLDPDRIAGSGGSAGGYLGAATTIIDKYDAPGEDQKVSSKPNIMVLFNPVVDFTGTGTGKTISAEESLALSPINHLAKGVPPAILFYGTADMLLAQARAFCAKARELGVTAELFTANGQKHGFFNNPPWTQVTLQKADEFLAKYGYVEGKPTVQVPKGAPVLKAE